jgi:hypothetical protein
VVSGIAALVFFSMSGVRTQSPFLSKPETKKAARLIILQGKPINPGGISVGPPVVLRHCKQRSGSASLSANPNFFHLFDHSQASGLHIADEVGGFGRILAADFRNRVWTFSA